MQKSSHHWKSILIASTFSLPSQIPLLLANINHLNFPANLLYWDFSGQDGWRRKKEKQGTRINGMQSLKEMSRSTLSRNPKVRTAWLPAPGIPWSPRNVCNANTMARVGAHISAQMFLVPAIQGAPSHRVAWCFKLILGSKWRGFQAPEIPND